MTQNSSADDDLFTLAVIGAGSIGLIISFILALVTNAWSTSIHWLLDHQIVVARHENPLITLPYAGGAGLDTARCFILAAILLLLLFGAAQVLRRAWARRQELA